MRKITMLLSCAGLLAVGLLAFGCNTAEGFGRDLERGGEKLQHEANEHR
jgi:predicted small secreted protein